MHPTSLSGAWGIGDLGPTAYQFVDLKAAGQSWWQTLPLGPTGFGDSPYMRSSAFAGNPLSISPAKLLEDGLVSPGDVECFPPFSVERVDYRRVSEHKRVIFEKSYKQFKTNSPAEHRQAFSLFREKHASWLENFSPFMALKETHRGHAWTRWDKPLRTRDAHTLQTCSRRLRDRVDYHRFLQYLFFHQWAALRQYCHANGIQIIGDLPIYIAHDRSMVDG